MSHEQIWTIHALLNVCGLRYRGIVDNGSSPYV